MDEEAFATRFLTIESVNKEDLIRIMREEIECIVLEIVSRPGNLAETVLRAVGDYAKSDPSFQIADVASFDLLPPKLRRLLEDLFRGHIEDVGVGLSVDFSIEDGLLEIDGVRIKSE